MTRWSAQCTLRPVMSRMRGFSDCGNKSVELVVAGELVLADGQIVTGEVGIHDGRIVAISEPGALVGDDRIDASRLLVLPGHVDVHVHTGSEPAEGVELATAAAACGGVTTIIDMPYDEGSPVNSAQAFHAKSDLVSRRAIIDVALYATILKTGGLEEIDPLVKAGAAAFKLSTFETDPLRFPRIPDGELYLALQRLASSGALAAFHPENDDIVERLTRELALTGRVDAGAHSLARPPVAETEPIGRILELAFATRARVHMCHVSVARGFELVARARAEGVDATAETCAHYLLLDDRELERQGSRAKCNPPLRSAAEVEKLWGLLASGCIDIVASDHVGWLRMHKEKPDIRDAKAGFPGVELTLPLLFSEGVVARRLPLHRLLNVLCENPARRFGLWPRKGSITVGADADLVILDPQVSWRVDEAELATAAGWSPYHGRKVTGQIAHVVARGRRVVVDGKLIAPPGSGRVIAPSLDVATPVFA